MRPATHSAPLRLTWLAASLVAALSALLATVGADAHWLAALGREIVRAGAIPVGVPYAAAPSAGWENVPVLGELVFHALEAGLGDRGLVVAQALAVAAALTFLALDMRRGSAADAPSALVLLLLVFAAAPSLIVVRAQLFSLVLFPLTLLLLRSEARLPSGRIWLLVPLVALWSNLHGGVLVGLAVAAAYLLLSRLRRQPAVALGVLGASVAALFVTPALLETADYYRGVLGSEAAGRGEGMWAPLSLSAPFDVAFVVVALPLVAGALASRPRAWELAVLAALALASAHTSRNGVWLVLFAAAPAALGLTGSRVWRLSPSPRVVLVLGGALAALLVIGLARAPQPIGAGEHLREQAAREASGTPILADDINAEQLALDGRKVWIGNPLDAFGRREQGLYLDWLAGRPAGDAELAHSRAVLVTRGSPADQRLARSPAFREAGRDERAVLYVPASPAR